VDDDLTTSRRDAPQRSSAADAPEWAARHSDVGSPICTTDWLALREPADAQARATSFANRPRTPARDAQTAAVIADLGSGSGSMGRWLAPRRPGPQHWVLHDRDPALLAVATLPPAAADGTPVTVETRAGELTALGADDLAGVDLVTASALLDMLTVDEVNALAAACVEAGVPALLTLTVTGGARLEPAEGADAAFAAAFDGHQRRVEDGRRLLGPDAGDAAVAAFTAAGAHVETERTPWHLDATTPERAALLEEWLRGWIDAACEHDPALADGAGDYLRRRLEQVAAGTLRAEVGHVDVLAVPA